MERGSLLFKMIGGAAVLLLFLAHDARAHCDTMNGPVVKAAREALDRGDVRHALVWVQPRDEGEIRAAFEKTVAVRSLGGNAKALAERFFFETLVRVHRSGEGAPYTGLKDADAPAEPGITMAEEALVKGSVAHLTEELNGALRQGLGEMFGKAYSTRDYPSGDVEAGRRHVSAYVSYIHYVERLRQALSSERLAEDVSAHVHED